MVTLIYYTTFQLYLFRLYINQTQFNNLKIYNLIDKKNYGHSKI